MVEEVEQRLQEREGLDDIKLGHKLEALAIRESSLDSCLSSLMVMTRELAVDGRETNLNTRATEMAKREKRLVRHGESRTS
jgi:hypothetical protein